MDYLGLIADQIVALIPAQDGSQPLITNLKANLCGAILSGAMLRKAKLHEATLVGSDLSRANLSYADLTGADLSYADLTGADLTEVDISGANLRFANLTEAIYEVKAGTSPNLNAIARAKALSKMWYRDSPQELIGLREAFKKAGLRQQEREVTSAIKRGEAEWIRSGLAGWFSIALFGWTCDWGMSPWRPIVIVLYMLFCMSFVNLAFLIFGKNSGIWAVWPDGRVRKDVGGKDPERITLEHPTPNSFSRTYSQIYRYAMACGMSLYFSLLSTFHIGGLYFNVGNWIARLQPREYVLQGTGWIRLFSGLQSIISVYLIGLWLFAYFGRPFE